MAKKTTNKKQEAVSLLIDLGWEPDGQTVQQTVRIPTTDQPLLGKSGGELAILGGRLRFKKGRWLVTVGKITTFFYPQNGVSNFRVKTKEIEEINRIARSLFI